MKGGFSVPTTGKHSFLMWLQILYLETVPLTNNYFFIIGTVDREGLLGQAVLCSYTEVVYLFATES